MATLRIVSSRVFFLTLLCAGAVACAESVQDDADRDLGTTELAQSEGGGEGREGPHRRGRKACGGAAGMSCEAGQFCNLERAAEDHTCDVAGATGVCETAPTVCTYENRPVCGCDHRTYATACAAHRAGVSVLHERACTERDCSAVGGTVVEAARIDEALTCPAGATDHGIVHTPSSEASGADAICCAPR